ncbi:PD40 domain-containing protein [Hymenobacter sp. BT594]|uniref:PD40 domain-containing protein n=1 Tax=Hymenobacter guriensis TaxID=2793065 RepID=A0ABS0L2F9_9BACT|nr:PD40 domain-containing protein [Hymenobacter guriensis]
MLLLLVALPYAGRSQTSQEPFGRVRIQYKQFDWSYYSTSNFTIYFYPGGEATARRTAEYAEKELQRITALLGYYPYSKTTIMLYNSVSDLRQSNVGLNSDKYQMGGETDLLRMDKVQIAFQGQQTVLKRDVSYQVTRVLLHDMMYGGSLKEVIQSNYLLQLPDWFVSGAAAYTAEGWSVEMDEYMRNLTQEIEGNRAPAFFARNQELAGQSVWNYIAERYGYTSIQNILNLTRITRDVETGISSSLNVPYKTFLKDWLTYYRQLNAQPETPFAVIDDKNQLVKRNRRGAKYSQMALSPSGKEMAYVTNDRGRYRVVVGNTDGSGRHTIYRGGYKTPDQQVDFRLPVLTWRSNEQLAVVETNKGKLNLRLRPTNRGAGGIFSRLVEALPFGRQGNTALFSGFTQVMGLHYSPDGKSLVFSGAANGQNDLYLLRSGSRTPERLTNDLFDDVQPAFLPGGQGIVFSSNRWLDTTGTVKNNFANVVNNYDLFLYHLDGRVQPVEQLVSTISNESAPRPISDTELVFLSEESGVRSLYRYNLSTRQYAPVSSFLPNIRSYDYSAATGALDFIAADEARDYVYGYASYPLPEGLRLAKTARQETLEERSKPAPAPKRPAPVAPDTTRAGQTATTGGQKKVGDYQYEEDTPPARTQRRTAARTTATASAADGIALAGPFRYGKQFSIDNVVSSLYVDPLLGFGIIGQANLSDLMEDHRFRAGIFALTDFRTSNIFAEYSNLRHRYDWGISYQKQSYSLDFDFNTDRLTRHEVAPRIAYPLTHNLNVRMAGRYVNVRRSRLADFSEKDLVENFVGGSAELVFDNAIATGVNMLEGTRMKAGAQMLHAMRDEQQSFGKFFVDLRHYQKIHRQIIWANRASYGHFFGNATKTFRLGGMDNWLNKSYDGDEDALFQGHPANVFYQEFVTNLRGFNYNARTGPKYVLFNSELRVPIIQYFSRKPIESGFFRNLQLTAFADAGSAYAGSSPFNENNSYNTREVLGNGNAFSATVIDFRNPLLLGYGLGARTTLLGFYGKLDVAWGQEDEEQTGPKFYFTLGYDF